MSVISFRKRHRHPPTKPLTKATRKGAERVANAARDFQYPTSIPSVDAMLDELERSDLETGFGIVGCLSAAEHAAKLDCEIFNSWVKLRARTLGMREPGKLSVDQFVDRYWPLNQGKAVEPER